MVQPELKFMKTLVLAFMLALAWSPCASAAGIDPVNKWAWSENTGWINFNPSKGHPAAVYDDHLEGYAWSENTGFIRLGSHTGGGAHTYANNGPGTYGVNNDGAGHLSGHAWGENIGWINFSPTHGGVSIDPATGRFSGHAWSESLGWISFNGTAANGTPYGVRAATANAPTAEAGGPYTGNEGAAITLSAHGSSDPDNNIQTYKWDLDNDGSYDDATGVAPAFTWNAGGTYTIGLLVTDATGASHRDTATVTVIPLPSGKSEDLATKNGIDWAATNLELSSNARLNSDGAGISGGRSDTKIDAQDHGALTISFNPAELPYGVDNLLITMGDFRSRQNDSIKITVYDPAGTAIAIFVQAAADDNNRETIDLTKYAGIGSIDLAPAGGQDCQLCNVKFDPAFCPIPPRIISAVYSAKEGVLMVTGTHIPAQHAMDINVSLLTLTGRAGSHPLTPLTPNVNRDSETGFTVAMAPADRAALMAIMDKDGMAASDGTPYNLSAADDWCTRFTMGDTSDPTGNPVEVINANRRPHLSVAHGAFTEGHPATDVDAAGTAGDADGDTDWDTGAGLTIQITDGAHAHDELAIDTTGNFTISSGNLFHSGTVIAALADTSGTHNDGIATNGDILAINFRADATNTIVQELVRAVTYRNTSLAPTADAAIRTVTFTLNDKEGLETTATPTITITPVNQAPALTNPGLTGAHALDEGATAAINPTHLTALDPDDQGTGLLYTVTALPVNGTLWMDADGDGRLTPGEEFTKDATFTQADLDNNRLRYTHDGGETLSDTFLFTLADGGEDGVPVPTEQIFTITVNGVNDAPVINDLDGDSCFYRIGDDQTVMDQPAKATVTDADSIDFYGGILTVSIPINKEPLEDVLTIDTGDAVSIDNDGSVTMGHIVSVSGEPVAEITADGNTGNDLELSFNQAPGNTTLSQIQEIIRALAYHNTNTTAATESTRTVRFVLTDGDGGASAPSDVKITVTANLPPSSENRTITIAVNGIHSFNAADFPFSDPEGDALRQVSIVTTPNPGTLALAGTPVTPGQDLPAAGLPDLTFTPAPGQSGSPYASFSFTVNDGTNDSLPQTMTINVSPLDSDGDGTPDCNDNCPDDPGKINPGTCGCGTPDIDSDKDGTPDCNDNCPNDPGKIDPGTCGCGTPDIDSDKDGTPDCNDIDDPLEITEDNTTVRSDETRINKGIHAHITIEADGRVNNRGTLSDLTNNGTISGGTVTGDTTNNGRLHNVTLATGTRLTNRGGEISGTTRNNGAIFGGAIRGVLFNNGILSGNAPEGSTDPATGMTIETDTLVSDGQLQGPITNNGILHNVTLGEETVITFGATGRLTGTVVVFFEDGGAYPITIPEDVIFPSLEDSTEKKIILTPQFLLKYAKAHDWRINIHSSRMVMATAGITELPPISEEYILINGLVLAPESLKAASSVAVGIPYELSDLPAGYGDKDLLALVYDAEAQKWTPAPFTLSDSGTMEIRTDTLSACAAVLKLQAVTPDKGYILGALDGDTTEKGGTATFTLALASCPSADVTIGISSSDPTEGTVSPPSITFTPATWDSPRTVALTGIDDGIVDGNQPYYAVLAPAVSQDLNYNGVAPGNVAAQNRDNDLAPCPLAPIKGEVVTSSCPTLKVSALSAPGFFANHTTSCWQVATASEFGEDTLILEIASDEALTALKIPEDTCRADTTYYWRVKCTDDEGVSTLWSQPAAFTTPNAATKTEGDGGGGSGGCFIRALL